MALAPLPPQQLAAAPQGYIHQDFFRWLGRLIVELATKERRLVRTASKTADYSAAAWDRIPVDTTDGDVTITLPTADTLEVGDTIAVKHVTAVNAFTVDGNGKTIDGYSTIIVAPAASYGFVYNGSNWEIWE